MNANGTKDHATEARGTSRLSAAALDAVTADPPEREPTLRELVRRVIVEDGLSQREAAQQSGVGIAVLNQWLADRYTGNNAKAEEKIRAWLKARGERISMAAMLPTSPEFFESATALQIVSHLKFAHSLQDMLTVFGVPGVGKTTAIRYYQRAYPNVWIATMTPTTVGVVPALQEISEALMLGLPNGARKLAQGILGKVRGTNGLLIIDEAHHMGVAALDALRGLHDASGIAIAFVGGPELEATLQRMPQFYSRVGLRLFVSRVLPADVEAQLDAWGIRQPAARKFLLALSQKPGALRGITKTVRLASMLATSAGESLDVRHIKDAADTLASQVTGEE